MNLYILVEGEQTEVQLYPKWLSYLLPELSRVFSYKLRTENSYYLFSGGGIPSIYNHMVNAIKDINTVGNYDYLIVALDAEELNVGQRKAKIYEHLDKHNIMLNEDCQLEIVVHNPCVETWFLGNRKVYKRNPQGEKFRTYANFYNVEQGDPELMPKFSGFSRTAHFHESYLKEMLKEHNIQYRKSRPKVVLERHYFEELMKRIQDAPAHLESFSGCLQLFERIKSELIKKKHI